MHSSINIVSETNKLTKINQIEVFGPPTRVNPRRFKPSGPLKSLQDPLRLHMHSTAPKVTAVSSDEYRRLMASPNFGNDYNLYYLHTGLFPQTHVQNIADPFVGYPKLQLLHQLKREHNLANAINPMGRRCGPASLAHCLSSMASQGTQFDVVMVHGCVPGLPPLNALCELPIGAVTPRPSLIFLWVPTSRLDDGRRALEHWGFRRSEDIVYMVTSPDSPHMPPTVPEQLLRSTSWHCLMGLKGTLRRSEDGNLINCNVDIDVIVEEPGSKVNVVPEKMYELIENFSLMSRRMHVVLAHTPETVPVRLRPGWVMMGPDVLVDNVEPGHFRSRQRVPVNAQIDSLRPRTPPPQPRKKR